MNSEELNSLIESYVTHNSSLRSLNKQCNDEKDKIKSYMLEANLEALESELCTLELSRRENVSLNEDKMMELLKSYWADSNRDTDCPYIKTKEYIDMDELENAMFNNELPNWLLVAMNDCKVVSTTNVLNIKKKGAKK